MGSGNGLFPYSTMLLLEQMSIYGLQDPATLILG